MPRRRAGRKRRLDCARTPGGRAVPVARPDRGTAELRAHRRLLAGPGGDVTKASDPIDLLLDRGAITPDHARAARWFGRLAAAILGRAYPRSSLNTDRGGEISDARLAVLAGAFKRIGGRLSHAERDALLDLTWAGRHPAWLLRAVARQPLPADELAARQTALQALASLLNAWLKRGGGAGE